MNKPILIIILLLGFEFSQAQGPTPAYFYNSNTNLPWAKCNILFQKGSKQQVLFLPVINYFAPTGTKHYSKDANIQCPVQFIGNGIVNDTVDCYQSIDAEGEAVLFYFDFPDSVHQEAELATDLRSRIYSAFDKNVSAIIICMYKKETPFLAYQDSTIKKHADIPIITINKDAAKDILLASGLSPQKITKAWKKGDIPESQKLIINLDLYIKGKYDKISADKGSLFYDSEAINSSSMSILSKMHDRSITFLLDLFKDAKPGWKNQNLYYFADYDSKVFYTRHWGHAASHITGNYYVYKNSYGSISENPYGLTVHENTHLLFFQNWMDECKGASSFFFEGTAMYAQAMATDPDKNNQKTYEYLTKGQLFPLSEMLGFNIGQKGLKTDVGYPASGSFVQYLIETYGLKNFMLYWYTGDWKNAFHSTVDKTDEKWRDWLESNNNS